MTIDFTGASENLASGLSAADERPLSINAQKCAASFEINLQAAQLVSAPVGLGMSPPDDPLDDPETSDISEDLSPAEQMMRLGVTLPLPIELRPDDTAAASFGIDLLASQLVAALRERLGTSPPDVPLEDQETSDISEDLSPAEQMMWLGVTLPLPIEQRSEVTVASTEDDSPPLVPSDFKRMSRAELPPLIEVGPALVGDPCKELSTDPRSVSIAPVTVDGPTPDPGHRSTPETNSPAVSSPSSTMDESLSTSSSLGDVRLPMGEQALAQPAVEMETPSFDEPAPDAEISITADRPTGFASIPMNSVHTNEVHTNIPPAETQSSHIPRGVPDESRTELSEVVRQVRTMVTEHETRTTIQLEPAELGRLTLELVDAPEGLRAFVSAEDPAVMRFLERNVQLLETEARLQGVGHMSFSVGADVSGGLGRGDQRQSEAEATFRKTIEWNTAPHAKPRSRRELDTNA